MTNDEKIIMMIKIIIMIIKRSKEVKKLILPYQEIQE